MRAVPAVVAVALTAVLGACGDSGGLKVDEVEEAVIGRATEAVPLTSRALGARKVEATSQWQSCMAISWRYEAFAEMTAPAGDPTEQLDSVRSALLDAGYADATQADGHVTAARDDVSVDVQRSPARGERTWTVTVRSRCADYDGDDLDRVEDDGPTPLKGV